MLRQLLEARAAVPPRRHIEKLAKNEEVRCLGKGHFVEEESCNKQKTGGKQKKGNGGESPRFIEGMFPFFVGWKWCSLGVHQGAC